MYNKNNDIGWETKSNNGNGSYDDTSIKKQIEQLKKEKANKDDIFTMDNMGEDVKEAMAKGDLKLNSIPGYMPQTTPNPNLFNLETVNMNNYLNGNGTVQTNAGYPYVKSSDYIEVKPSTNYVLANDDVPIFYDEYDVNKTFLKNTTSSRSNSSVVIKTGSTTQFIRVNINTNRVQLEDFYVVEGREYDINQKDWTGNLFNIETVNTKQFINNSGGLMSNGAYPHVVVSDFIEVPAGGHIVVNFEGVTNWLSEYDENKNHIKHNPGNLGIVPRNVMLDSNTKYIKVNINTNVIALNDFYVMVPNQRNYETFDWLEKRLQEFQDSSFAPGGIATDVIASRFVNMRVLVTGDSITEKNFRCNKNWHDYLKEWYGWSKVYNDGVSGSGLVKNTGIVHRLPNWKTNYGGTEDIDMILIMGNMNDGTSEATALPEWLGSFEDQDETMKTSSLYGALHYTCQQILSMPCFQKA